MLLAVSVVLLVAGSLRCVRPAFDPAEQPARFFVTDARIERFPLYAAAVKAQQKVSPTIWLVVGDPFADTLLKTLTDGAAQVALLNRSGIDAIVMTPEWLSFGMPRLTQIVSQCRHYSLSASLLDGANQAIGHPFMVRKSGPSILAVAGVALDSTNVLRHLAGVRYVSPDLAAGKAGALMRQRADVIGIATEPRSSGLAWEFDFTVNVSASTGFEMRPSDDTARINCYDVSADANRLTGVTLGTSRLKPDSSVAWVLDSVRAVTDSLALRSIPSPRTPWDAERLADTLVQGVLASKLVDGFLCDSLLTRDFGEPKDVGTLVSILRDAGRLAILTVSNDALSDWPRELVLRTGLSRSQLPRGQSIRIATTVDYLRRHPAMAGAGFELSARPFWTICLDILESGQDK